MEKKKGKGRKVEKGKKEEGKGNSSKKEENILILFPCLI